MYGWLIPMKKLLSIIILGLFLSFKSYADTTSELLKNPEVDLMIEVIMKLSLTKTPYKELITNMLQEKNEPNTLTEAEKIIIKKNKNYKNCASYSKNFKKNIKKIVKKCSQIIEERENIQHLIDAVRVKNTREYKDDKNIKKALKIQINIVEMNIEMISNYNFYYSQAKDFY